MSKKRDRSAKPRAGDPLALKHFRFGWWMLVVFLCLGLLLDALNGFKVGAYLDVSNETRRLMWTLAHVHGALIGIVHIAFAATRGAFPGALPSLASSCLIAASLLIPAGFFLGGWLHHDGDPGLGILLVPPGALLLISTAFLVARALTSLDAGSDSDSGRPN